LRKKKERLVPGSVSDLTVMPGPINCDDWKSKASGDTTDRYIFCGEGEDGKNDDQDYYGGRHKSEKGSSGRGNAFASFESNPRRIVMAEDGG